MQSFILLTMLVLMSGCTAMVLGGGAAGNSQTTVTSTTDATISARVRSQLAADTALSAFDFSVRSHSGAVTLGGSVDSHIAREQAARVAKATDGVRSVTNQIVVE